MRTRHLSVLLALALCSSCSAAREDANAPAIAFANEPQGSGDYWSREGGSPAPDVGALEGGGAMVVPPDRALVRVDATVAAASPSAVTARVRAAAAQLADGLSEENACAATIADYAVPWRADERWHARVSLRLDVPLRGASDVGERLARLERCMRRFETLGPSLRDAELSVSDPLVTVDDPGRHRTALLARAMGPLHEVAAIAGTPAAFAADAMQCTSRGQVSIVGRALSGVALQVDLDCRPRGAPVAAAPGQTAPPS